MIVLITLIPIFALGVASYLAWRGGLLPACIVWIVGWAYWVFVVFGQ